MNHELDFFRPSRWNLSRDVSEFQKGVTRLFEDLGWSAQAQGQTHALAKPAPSEIAFAPACDVEEIDGQYLLSFDLPGVARENIKIELNDRDLAISGEKKEERKETGKSRRFIERTYGSFYRSFTLPNAMSAEQIHANFENGVLKITIPKTEAAKSKQIPIGDAKTPAPSKTVQVA
jgi:HSP20 family protein